MRKIILLILLISASVNESFTQAPNCTIEVTLKNVERLNRLYFNNGDYDYFFDSTKVADGIDTVLLYLTEPKHVTLFINNDAENHYNFYLHEGNYQMEIDCNSKEVRIRNSQLNDEYKEKMHVHDSLFKLYHIMHARLYPYNHMDRDSAHAILRKYGPLCDSLSGIHIRQFNESHPNSFLTLQEIYNDLEYTFEDPGHDTTLYNKKELKARFDKLDPKLSRYKMYQDCMELFRKEYPKITEPQKPLYKPD